MSTESNTQLPAPAPAPAADPSSPVDISGLLPVPRRLQGKIPALTKPQRDMINSLLLNGATYNVVSQRMAEQGSRNRALPT